MHTVGLFPEQENPAAGPVQAEAHPIPSFDPSSHNSFDAIYPSPQVETQEDGAPVQVYPNSELKQSDEHPSDDAVLESSQISLPAMIPSPQTVEQTEGNPTQFHPDSVWQVEEHPSLFATLVSSQSSVYTGEAVVSLAPLPQVEVQTVGFVPVHEYPAAGPVHELAHPIPSFVPSSHPSFDAFKPSPQLETQLEGAPVQVNANSGTQVELHPSELAVPPSSHASGETMIPSPQTMEHVEGNPVHDHPDSVWQVELHPSPFAVLPWSHYSV